jgi:two-component system LytT family sensor kinase
MRDELSLPRAEHPNWWRVWIGLLLLWTIFTLLGTWFNYQLFANYGRPISWSQSVRINVAGYGIWGFALTPMVLFVCARLPLSRRNLFRLVPAHLLAIIGMVCIEVSLSVLLRGIVFPSAPALSFIPQFRRYFLQDTETDIHIYLIIVVIAYVVAYHVDLRNQEWRRAQLENNLVRADLQVLKIQMQPHFLFNTLHSVAALINTNPRAAQKMICSLGDLLRMSLTGRDLPEVTLRRELEFLDLYLDIQRVRFQDRLVTEIEVADEILDVKVPYLILQPLVENSIKHGVARRPGVSKVEILARKESEDLCISIVNDSGVPCVLPEQDRFGMGLENIKSRLRILYGSGERLSTQELPDGRFQVVVRVPWQSESIPVGEPRSVSVA